MRKVKFGSRFKSRPIKSAGARRQRTKVHQNRLIAAGRDQVLVMKMDPKSLREALKEI